MILAWYFPILGKATTWANTAKDNPLPVYYALKSITTLFRNKYFQNVEGIGSIDTIREKLIKHLKVNILCMICF